MSEQKVETAFIWYHADVDLTDALAKWVRQIGRQTGISARLLIRRQVEKTTFMEIYPDISPQALCSIEQMAHKQPWFRKLGSERRTEFFTELG